MLHRLLFYLLLMLAPMLLGSNRPLFWSINGVLSAIILAGFVWSEFGRGRSQSDWRLPFMAISAQAAVGAWIAFQASSWTPKMWHHPIWSISPLLSNSHGAISADPSQTWQTLGWWCTLAVFIVAVRIGTSPRRALFLLKLMVAVCLLVATFGLAAEWFSLNTLGLLQKTHYLGWLTGTFVSRNTAATFIGMGLIIAMALAGREIDRNWIRQRGVFSNFLDLIVGAGGFYTLVAGVLFASLLLTGSRGGTATVVLGGGLLCALKLMKQRQAGTRSFLVLAGAMTIIGGITFATLHDQNEDAAGSMSVRLSLYSEALKAIEDRPILGHGAGAFASIEPLYHQAATPSKFVWDHAHSTVLEAAVTLGIPVTVLCIIVLGYILGSCGKFWWSSNTNSTCTLAALCASAAVTMHACVDFSLEIQAVALYVACLLGLAMGEKIALPAIPASEATVQFGMARRRRATMDGRSTV